MRGLPTFLRSRLPTRTAAWSRIRNAPRKIRFNGRQVAAYRFVYCVLTGSVLTEDQVVRHRCHNRRCVNPKHLIEGTRADNKRDDYDHWANGTDYRHL